MISSSNFLLNAYKAVCIISILDKVEGGFKSYSI